MALAPRLFAVLLWLTLICVGFGFAWRYEASDGPRAQSGDWPMASRLALDARRPTILMFTHPECPCTKVSVEELAAVANKRPGAARILIVLVKPAGLSKDPLKSRIAALAREVPGAELVVDIDGKEARRFGAKTSGQVLAFSPAGKQVFNGGVTVARGHYGASDGSRAIERLLNGSEAEPSSTKVFGCGLFGGREGSR